MNQHPTPCSGCPLCSRELARTMQMDSRQLAGWLNATQRSLRGRALRTGTRPLRTRCAYGLDTEDAPIPLRFGLPDTYNLGPAP